MRSGWVTASRMPATALASVWRDAKPTTAATIALEARNGATSLSSASNCAAAIATPMTTIVTSITRRSTRSRVSASGVSAPPASRAATASMRRAIARSTTNTITAVMTSAMSAVTHWSLSDHQDASSCVAPWAGMERDRSAVLSRRPALAAARPRLSSDAADALRLAWRATWVSRVLVWAAGLGALAIWGNSSRAHDFDPTGLTSPFGAFGDALVAPAARWDSVWYLNIAQDGYGAHGRSAFFPLYPLLVRAGAWITGSPVVAGALISTACLVVALAVVHELTRLELGSHAALWTVVALAFSPVSFFFSAVYSESLFLALSAGTLLAARRGRWWWAGALGALAAATRSAGIVLLVPLALLAWRPPSERGGPRRHPARATRTPLPGSRPRPRPRDALGLALVPLGLFAFMGAMALDGQGAMAPFHVQDVWFRAWAGPLGGVPDAITAAWDGAHQLLSGQREHVYFTAAGGDPFTVARMNLMLFASLLAAIPALVGAVRRLPLAYPAYAVAALALPLSYPVGPQPLMSLPRFELVLLPLWMWWGWWLSRHPRARLPALVLSAVALVVFTGMFATWRFVA